MTALTDVDFSSNAFSGTILPSWGNTKLLVKSISIANNYISGTLPATLANLVRLVKLNLSNNSLTGTIPLEFAQLRGLTHMYAPPPPPPIR